MTDLLPPLPLKAADEVTVFSVAQLATAVQKTVEVTFGTVRVRGEVCQAKTHSSGHIYFAIKDETAVLNAICWRGVVSNLPLKPEDGLDIICTGRLTTYPARSQYQLIVTSLELAGQGALLKMLEERKRRLTAEGLFDPARKKPLPFLPNVIGVVTSPTGAVIQDILHRLRDRFPRHVLLWPVAVQGNDAAAQVSAAIHGFNALPVTGTIPRPDVLIVARGGGSLEDLMPFNEESVVRAAAASRIPLISAVGHETDTTLIDLAADRRAPTPTAAAEMAVPVRADLLAQAADMDRRLIAAVHRSLRERHLKLTALGRGLQDPKTYVMHKWQNLDDRRERLGLALGNILTTQRTKLAHLKAILRPPQAGLEHARLQLAHQVQRLKPALDRWLQHLKRQLDSHERLLESYSFKNVLARGYALVKDPQGQPVTAAAQLRPGQKISLQFQDGETPATVDKSVPVSKQGQLFN